MVKLKPKLKESIISYLALGWLPEQISGRLKKTSKRGISQQSIYNYLRKGVLVWGYSANLKI